MILPAARNHQLTIQELPEETLVFDHINQKAHCLNQTSRQVWKLCDGQTSLAEAAHRLELPEVAVGLALEQLERRRLLQGPVVPFTEENRRTRRDLLKKLAAAALALPVIMTIKAPSAWASASALVSGCTSDGQCANLTNRNRCITGRCQGGKCVAVGCPPSQRFCFNGTCSAG